MKPPPLRALPPLLGLVLLAAGGSAGGARQEAGAPAADAGQERAPDARVLEELRPPRIVPARPFRWDEEDRGTVDLPLGAEGGWVFWPPVLQWRFAPPITADPIVEVIVYAPYSGDPMLSERFKLQIPLTTPPSQRGLLVAYHGFGLSEQQIFQGSTLPAECTQKGWLLLAPLGLIDVNFGNVQSQRATESSIALVASFFPFDFDRLYTFGFSMGGVSATSFAFRHQDPGEIRVAGVAYHTGTTDLVRNYDEGDVILKMICEHPFVFGGSPAHAAFAYDRVNPMRFLPPLTGFDPEKAQVHSLLHTPLYVYANANDPLPLDQWTVDLANDLAAQGAQMDFVHDLAAPAVHAIGTVDEGAVLDWAEQHPLGPLPSKARLFADRPGQWLWTRLVDDPGTVARWTVEITAATNSFAVSDTHAVGTLEFDLGLMGLDPSQPLSFTAESGDGTADVYVLTGYAAPPSSVLVDGGAPLSWSHDPVAAEIVIEPNLDGSAATIDVAP